SLLFSCYCSSRSLHSFPTRRSSDLSITASLPHFRQIRRYTLFTSHSAQEPITGQILPGVFFSLVPVGQTANFIQHAHNTQESMRSEEHTSELQSRENLVCRLLLEKK